MTIEQFLRSQIQGVDSSKEFGQSSRRPSSHAFRQIGNLVRIVCNAGNVHVEPMITRYKFLRNIKKKSFIMDFSIEYVFWYIFLLQPFKYLSLGDIKPFWLILKH